VTVRNENGNQQQHYMKNSLKLTSAVVAIVRVQCPNICWMTVQKLEQIVKKGIAK
jgi:cytochrome oxidase Cu insertion factor (SCO1/SenC/PrrC family)